MTGKPNIASRTSESVSALCPVCGERVSFRPSVEAVQIGNANQNVEPHLRVILMPGNFVKHACVDDR